MFDQPVEEIVELVKKGDRTVQSLTESCLDRINKIDQKLNSVLHLNEAALQQAKFMDQQKEKKGRLFGVPILVKDNFCVKGMRATAASKILENFEPPYTAHCIQRLQDEGAIILGKTNLDEFAMGSSNENSAFGPCKNPWDESRVPGGSSGGSAVAAATGMAPLTIGSDTGGSIRQPASFCGVVGVKPTYGAISRFGMVAFASSLDQAGPFSRRVADSRLALEVMIGKDGRDATNVDKAFDFSRRSGEKYRVGLAKPYLDAKLNSDIKSEIQSLILKLESEGHEIIEIDLPHTEYAIPVYYLVSGSEASSNLSRYDGVRYGLRDVELSEGHRVNQLADFYKLTRSRGFGNEVKRRILLGTFALSAGYCDEFYLKACQVRRKISEDFTQAFNQCDFVVGPVSTDTAFKVGDKVNDPVSMYFNDILTVPANLAGLPAMSLPLGKDSQGLPFGLQIIAPAFADAKMLNFAEDLEQIIQFSEAPSV